MADDAAVGVVVNDPPAAAVFAAADTGVTPGVIDEARLRNVWMSVGGDAARRASESKAAEQEASEVIVRSQEVYHYHMADEGQNSKSSHPPSQLKIRLPDEEAARKYCRDALLPGRPKTAIVGADKHTAPLHAVVTRVDKLWGSLPYIIKYSFVSGEFGGTDMQHDKVKRVIQEWTLYANVEFKEVFTGQAELRIAFDPDGGSWSLVGTDNLKAKNQPTMNLGWIDPESEQATDSESAVILHEVCPAMIDAIPA
jgi:hypothetical protein